MCCCSLFETRFDMLMFPVGCLLCTKLRRSVLLEFKILFRKNSEWKLILRRIYFEIGKTAVNEIFN